MRKFIPLILVIAVLVLAGCSSPSASAGKSSTQPSSSSTQLSSSSAQVSSSSSSAESPQDRTSATADTVFGFPEQFNVKSGSGNSIGTVAVFSAASSDCTVENLELWCNQYLRWGLDNWAVIEYSDKPGYGVYGSGDMVEVGVSLASDYSLDDDSDAVFYVFSAPDVTSDGHLSKIG